MNNPAIVVIAFDRPHSLKRLLISLSKANYQNKEVELFISIDFSNNKRKNQEVIDIANSFNWINEKKTVDIQKNNIGLRKHILKCGDLLINKFESIIMLEDDSFVSPYFYNYVLKSLELFSNIDAVCGISLYSPKIHEYTESEFVPLNDGFDNYFVQSASSWGQAWNRRQWNLFREWYEKKSYLEISDKDNIPKQVIEWPNSSWKKYFIKYQQESKRFFSFPRVSLSTNFADAGTHFTIDTNLYQTALLYNNKTWNLSTLNQSESKYDCFYEILDISTNDCLQKDIEFDIFGTKALKNIKSEYLISTKKCTHPIKKYSDKLKPSLLNILYNIPGDKITYGKTIDFVDDYRLSNLKTYEHLGVKFLLKLLLHKFTLYFKRILNKQKDK